MFVRVCAQHFYARSLYLMDAFGCSSCPAGQFCATPGLTLPSGQCQAGSYCPGGDTTSTGT